MLVFADVDVPGFGQLIQLALDHPEGHLTEQPDEVQGVIRQRHPHRLDVEIVAEEHRDVVPPPGVHRQLPPAHVRIIDDVIVDEGRGMDELDHRGVVDSLLA